jgi:aryl sulfotransferase
MCNHLERFKAGELARLQTGEAADPGHPMTGANPLGGDIHRFFPAWLHDFGHIEHVRSYWARRLQANVLMVHYNDLKADLEGEMRRIAAFLGIEVPEALFPACVERCTFERMREDPQRMGSFDLFEGGLKGFIFKGTNGRWKDVLTPEELAAWDARVQALLTPEAAAWMETGSRGLIVGKAGSPFRHDPG